MSIVYTILGYAFWAFQLAAAVLFLTLLLTHFNVISKDNGGLKKLQAFLEKILAPLLVPLRKLVPSIAGIDFAPLAAAVIIQLIATVVFSIIL